MPRSEAGASFAALMAAITIMLIGLGVAAPTWHYLAQDDREQELLFRGMQIVKAIERSKQHPTSLKLLVDGKFLRPALWAEKKQDPITKGPWRLIHENNPLDMVGCGGPGAPPGAQPNAVDPNASTQPRPQATGQGATPQPTAPASPQASPQATTQPGGSDSGPLGITSVGPIIGVRSTSHDQSLRVFWGKNHYDEWCFVSMPNFATVPPNVWSIRQLTYPKLGVTVPEFKSSREAKSPAANEPP